MNASEMTFGIEIECVIPAASLSRLGWVVGSYHRGRAIPGHEGWKIEHDGSLMANAEHHYGCTCDGCSPLVALEVVSPKLKGEAGVAAVVRMLETLRQMGATVNPSCGLHVHVGASADLDFLHRLVCFTANVEQGIYAMTGTRRREESCYCESVRDSHRPFGDSGNRTELALATSSRYKVLNLSPLVSGLRQAVEFRAFEGTLETQRVLSYLFICLGIVERCQGLSRASQWNPKPVSAKSSIAGSGPGSTQAIRLMAMLAWSKQYLRCEPFGVINTPAWDLKTARKDLRAAAAAYDRE